MIRFLRGIAALGLLWTLPVHAEEPAAPAPAAPTAAAPEAKPEAKPADAKQDLAALLKSIDELYAVRDQGDAPKQLDAKTAEANKLAPDDFEVQWRTARWEFWKADISRNKDFKETTAKHAWEVGEKASKQKPDSIEAHYWTAVAVGTYGDTIGILTALRKGIEGTFRGHLDYVVEKKPGFDNGGPMLTLGRYYATLPWPKHDAKKAIASLKKALELNPKNLRARVYLAEVYLDEDEPKQADQLLNEVLSATPGAYDAPEERYAQKLAKDLKPKVEKELK